MDGTTLALYLSQRFDSHIRLKVANGSGTLINLFGRYKGIQLEYPNPNLPIGGLTVDFVRETTQALSLAPFVQASTYNRLDDGVTYNPLLQIGRTITMEVALTAEGATRPADGASTWYEVYRGTISSVKWPQRYGRTASISCTDMGGLLQKSKSEAEYTYTAGTAIETAIQQVLTNNGHTWVTLSVPVATGKVLPNDYAPGLQKTVWEQVWALAQSMGWLIWFTYSGTNTLALTLFEPPRGKTTPDQDISIIHDFTDFGIDETQIGNVGYVRYYDENSVQQEIGPVEDAASIAAYGGSSGIRRTFWIVLAADSPVRSSSSATDLLNAAIADVADPDVLASVTLPPMWFAEAAIDLYSFPVVDGRLFDVSQTAAPFAVSVSGRGDQPITSSLTLRGKPSSGAKAWSIVGGGEIITTGTGSVSYLLLPDVLDSFLLGTSIPYISAGGPTDAWPRRAFTVHTTADLSDWSLGGLFIQDVGNVALHGPQGLENYLRFQNTATVAGPNLGIISNAEHAGSGSISGINLYTGGLVINGSGNVTGNLTTFNASGPNRVSGQTGVASGTVIGFRGNLPSSSAAVTGTLWNAYMEGTAPNYFAGRTYFGSTADTTYLDRASSGVLATGGTFSASQLVVTASQVWTTSHQFSAAVGIGVAPTSSIGLNVRPTFMTGTSQFGVFILPTLGTGATTEMVGTNYGANSAASGSPYTTTNFRMLKVQAPSRGSNHTITTLTGLHIEDLTAVTAGTRWAVFTAGATNSAFGGAIYLGTSQQVNLSRVTFSSVEAVRSSGALDAMSGFYVNGTQVVTPTGTLAPGSVANAAAFAASLKPVEVWTYATLPTPGATDQVAFVTDWPLGGGPTAPKMARWTGSAWVALSAASEIVGQLTAGSIAAGAVTAVAMNVSTLSSISANVGTLNAGVLQNASGTRYIDLSAGTANFIQHEKLSLKHDGSAEFSGGIKLTATSNTIGFYNGVTLVGALDVSSGGDVRLQDPALTYGLAFGAGGTSLDAASGASLSLGVQSGAVSIGSGGATLGFFATGTPATKQTVTGSRGGNAALASLCSALAAYGLITNSTS